MTRDEILAGAHYIQYPLDKTTYISVNRDIKDKILKLPLPQDGEMYSGWWRNTNHFTTTYHRKYVLPLLIKLLNLTYRENDWELVERKSGNNDISYLRVKHSPVYEVYGFTRKEHFDKLRFDDLVINDSKNADITDYHRLYKYAHECSRIINKTIISDRKLFISGDSQFIPDIAFLSCYFKEVWYMDNRNHLSLSAEWKNTHFTDCIVEINCSNTGRYTVDNFQ